MNEKALIDKLYSENLELGNKINSLNDQNNFYKIQINNFNKLTNSINKDLYRLGMNFQNKQIVEDSAKVGPLFVISNKIKLKNLQLKIGNSIRQTQKYRKNLEGSLPFINKQIQNLEEQISIMLAKYMQVKQQNKLLQNISHGQNLTCIIKQFKQQMRKLKINEQISISQLQNKYKQSIKRLQFVKKQQKQKNRIITQLINQNQMLQNQVKRLKSLYPQNLQLIQIRAQEAKELQNLQLEQKKLLKQISIISKQLEQQYALNKQCKQRINDKKYQQNKQIKVLQEQVQKCEDQLKEFKQKYKKIRVSGITKNKQNQKIKY